MAEFGEYVRSRREKAGLSLRALAARIERTGGTGGEEAVGSRSARVGLKVARTAKSADRPTGVEPSYLSKVERGLVPPSDDVIRSVAEALDEDPDFLFALAGRVSEDFLSLVRKHPETFGTLIRQLKKMPHGAVVRLVREVRDGEW